jgi:soluble lytic murein transglycosylase-like protein
MSIQSSTSIGGATPTPSTDKEKKAWKAAQDFEAILLRQIFQSMRKASAIMTEDQDPEGTADTQMQDMAWDGLADQAATHGGMGLAKMLYPQLLGQDSLPTLPSALPKVLPDSAGAATAYATASRSKGSGATSLDAAVTRAASDSGLDPDLIRAVIRTESAGDVSARSSKGAIGPMQLMPGTAAELGVDPTDPVQNIVGGSRYLASLKRRFGDEKLALAAYNAGPGAVERHGGVPPYPETKSYVRKVLAARDQFKETP